MGHIHQKGSRSRAIWEGMGICGRVRGQGRRPEDDQNAMYRRWRKQTSPFLPVLGCATESPRVRNKGNKTSRSGRACCALEAKVMPRSSEISLSLINLTQGGRSQKLPKPKGTDENKTKIKQTRKQIRTKAVLSAEKENSWTLSTPAEPSLIPSTTVHPRQG